MAAKHNRTAGASVLNVQIDTDIRTFLERYAEVREETYRKIVERALRREFADPPPVEQVIPLPPLPEPPKKKPAK